MSKSVELSIDAVIRAALRDVVDDVVQARLAPVNRRLDLLTAASAPVLVDVAEAARRLGKSEPTIRRMAATGELPGRRLGRSWRIDLSALKPMEQGEVVALAAEARSR